MKNKNIHSHLTAKEREKISFPARFLFDNDKIYGEVLDYGTGFGKDVEFLKSSGLNIEGYDKYYFPTYPTKKYDTILCIYVLNVLFEEEQSEVLIDISKLLKPNGTAYFAVRRDIIHEGFRIHKIHKKPTYQCNVHLNYRSIFRNKYCEIYEYKHINRRIHSIEKLCTFCNPGIELELIAESASSYSVYDKYPVNSGHALIIPKRHVSNYFDLTFKEQSSMIFLLNKVKPIISSEFNPNGYNIGVNVHSDAGQTIPHVHLHLIPRYKGDVDDPTGGVRNVIPSKGNYNKT